jgi:hypothetical protein
MRRFVINAGAEGLVGECVDVHIEIQAFVQPQISTFQGQPIVGPAKGGQSKVAKTRPKPAIPAVLDKHFGYLHLVWVNGYARTAQGGVEIHGASLITSMR